MYVEVVLKVTGQQSGFLILGSQLACTGRQDAQWDSNGSVKLQLMTTMMEQ